MSSTNGYEALIPKDLPASGNGSPADRFLGLAGPWKQVANLGVVGVSMALLAYLVVSGRQDTAAIRNEAQDAHRGMAVMTDVLRETRDGQKDLTHAIKALSTEVRHLKAGLPAEPPPVARDRPGDP